ncbi:hypothetical protein [Paenibacillus endoradicis]|uniref:hypothetical protein n=1 Tax=Paenibacillus endoradicis TaxID=2972487 RepID=UPI0021590D6C|nr:hypothetical protein [Paenibacillus endoradicis]MCR8655700.1 hypothetical protein [Paenibacillus endoradicis]MCR8658026.1 hypothetical protein [Paenibacillus endoradicis]
MQHQNRITYRFDRNGNKIDSLQQQPTVVSEGDSTQELNIEQLEQLIREADGVIAHTEEGNDVTDIARPASEAHHRSRYELDLEELEEWQQIRPPYEVESNWKNTQSLSEKEDKHESRQSLYDEQLSSKMMNHDHRIDMDNYDLEASRATYPWQQPDWSAPIIDEVQITKNKQRFSWTNGLVAVLCAVLTGTLLGYLLLVQVFGSTLWPSNNSTETVEIEEKVVDQVDALPTTDENVPTVSMNTSEAQFSYQLLQAGVFSKENSRDEVIAALKKAGYAAAYTQANSGKYFVYAAIATSANNIEPFKSDVSGFELYRKELVLQLPEKLQYDGEAAQLESYIESSNQLIGMYADLVAAQLEQPTLSVIGASAQKASQTQYEQWENIANEAIVGFKGTTNESQATQLQQSLQLAQQQLLKYQEKPISKNIWSVEEAIVKAVLIQKEWFEQVNGLS